MKLKVLSILLFLPVTFALYANEMATTICGTDDPFVVVLDAGHGGHDPGNLGNGYLEKKIALNIVLRVGEILSKNKDIKVIYTRKDDTFVDLYVRGEIANKANADLFVSVHCDSHTSDAHGAGTFVLGLHANKQNFEIAKKENSVIYLEDNYENRYADYDINSPESVIGLTIMQEEFLDQSIALAKMIQDNFSNSLKRTNRKVKQAGFIVLHQTFMPSVLVETGFLTNKNEGAYLNSVKGQKEMGESIANAILTYKKGVKPGDVIQTNDIKDVVEEPIITQTEPEVKKVVVKKEIDTPKDDTEKVIVHNKTIAPEVITQPEEKKEPISEKEVASSILFRVQLLATTKDIPLSANNFKGLSKISREPYKKLYRYMYGETRSYSEAKMLQGLAIDKGYTTAYIVAYRLGVRISLKKAIFEVSE